MDPAELGKRIKEARLAKKMTQTDVVGDFITRNMLSQIESGNATPSVKTLTYLAQVLQMPVNYFLEVGTPERGHPEEPGAEPKVSLFKEGAFSDTLRSMKAAYNEKQYEKAEAIALRHIEPEDMLYDEACCILAMSYLALAKTEEATREAVRCAKEALKYADLGIFAKREIKTAAVLLLDELSEKL